MVYSAERSKTGYAHNPIKERITTEAHASPKRFHRREAAMVDRSQGKHGDKTKKQEEHLSNLSLAFRQAQI